MEAGLQGLGGPGENQGSQGDTPAVGVWMRGAECGCGVRVRVWGAGADAGPPRKENRASSRLHRFNTCYSGPQIQSPLQATRPLSWTPKAESSTRSLPTRKPEQEPVPQGPLCPHLDSG